MRLLGTVVRISRGKDCCNVENTDSIWKDFNQSFYLRGNTLGCSANLNCPVLLPADCLPGWLCLCRLPTLTGSSCQKLHCTLSTRSLSTFTVLHRNRTEIYFPFTGREPWGFCCFETRSHCVAGSGHLSALVLTGWGRSWDPQWDWKSALPHLEERQPCALKK